MSRAMKEIVDHRDPCCTQGGRHIVQLSLIDRGSLHDERHDQIPLLVRLVELVL